MNLNDKDPNELYPLYYEVLNLNGYFEGNFIQNYVLIKKLIMKTNGNRLAKNLISKMNKKPNKLLINI